jgi:biopolymer transport protein ExbB
MEFFDRILILFTKGGLVMYPLIVCSFILITIAIERGMYFRHAKTDISALMFVLDKPLKTKNWAQVRALCVDYQGIPARMLATSFNQPFEDRLQLEQALDGAATVAVSNLRYCLDFLNTIVTLSPLLGLLGTVTGMIQSFSIMTVQAGQPLAITGGVGEALVATATGLGVAILALVTHSYYSHQINCVISDMERTSNYVLSVVPKEKTL